LERWGERKRVAEFGRFGKLKRFKSDSMVKKVEQSERI
jgi:hypothetical protein